MRRLLSLVLITACGDDAKSAPSEGGAGGGCEAVIAKWEDTCGPEDAEPLEVCEADQGVWLGAGCDEEWAAFTKCQATTEPDCTGEDFGACEPKLNALFACQSQFVRRTGCTSLGYHELCGDETPYTIFCLGTDAPSKACVPKADGSDELCCP